MIRIALLAALLWLTTGCTTVQFLSQAAAGQWRLSTSGVPIDEAAKDSALPQQTRGYLREIPKVRSYASDQGLLVGDNYQDFLQLDEDFVVWFVNASAPLAFVPKVFEFPIVGSFPGLSWFHQADAEAFAQSLREEGWDVGVRGVRAFSTGGFFTDPLLSSMLPSDPVAIAFLVNVLLHESVHATVLVPDQQFFNESLASFVADRMTPEYLDARYGPGSHQLQVYRQRKLYGVWYTSWLVSAYKSLDKLYRSSVPIESKLRRKKHFMQAIQKWLNMKEEPNNASLIGAQLYHVGTDSFKALLDACGGQWPKFLAAAGSLRTDHFQAEQTPVIDPALYALAKRGCVPYSTLNKRSYASRAYRAYSRKRTGPHRLTLRNKSP